MYSLFTIPYVFLFSKEMQNMKFNKTNTLSWVHIPLCELTYPADECLKNFGGNGFGNGNEVALMIIKIRK